MTIFAVTTEKGPRWDHGRPIRDQPTFAEHARFTDELVARGIIILGGPLDDGESGDIALLAVEASDEVELRTFFAEDPWTVGGVFHIKEIRPWTWWVDGRRVMSD